MSSGRKPPLPDGWAVRRSKTYPDRVFYFNVRTGATTWYLDRILNTSLDVNKNKISTTKSESKGAKSNSVHSPIWNSSRCSSSSSDRSSASANKRSSSSILEKEKTITSKSSYRMNKNRNYSGSQSDGIASIDAMSSATGFTGENVATNVRVDLFDSSKFNSYNGQLRSDSSAATQTSHHVSEEEEEPMDIDVIDEEAMMIDIHEVRECLRHEEYSNPVNVPDIKETKNIEDHSLCIVIDTNILLSDCAFLTELKTHLQEANCTFIFLIPWIVFQELDYLKNKHSKQKNSLFKRAQIALDYLFRNLTAANHVRGQSMMEDSDCKRSVSDVNDDRILQCCLQYKQKGYEVILFTNDKNLINKSIVCCLNAYTRMSIVEGIMLTINKINQAKDHLGVLNCQTLKASSPNVPKNIPEKLSSNMEKLPKIDVLSQIAVMKKEIEDLLRETLATILEMEMKENYNDTWLHIVLIKPPWNLHDLFQCYKKHWYAVIGFFLSKYDAETMEKLHSAYKKTKDFSEPKEVLEYITLSISFLSAFQKKDAYKTLIVITLAAFQILRSKCEELLKCASVSDCNLKRKRSNNSSDKSPLLNVSSGRSSECSVPSTSQRQPKNTPSPASKLDTSSRERKFLSPKRSKDRPPSSSFVRKNQESSKPVERHGIKRSASSRESNDALDRENKRGRDKHVRDTSSCGSSNSRSSSKVQGTGVPTKSTSPGGYNVEVRKVFVKIWDSINSYCGLLCNALKVPYTITYATTQPRPPSLQEVQNFLPRIQPIVKSLSKELRCVIESDKNTGFYKTACLMLYNSLVTFYPSLDILDKDVLESSITPEMVLDFCSDTNNESSLSLGLVQITDMLVSISKCIQASKKLYPNTYA